MSISSKSHPRQHGTKLEATLFWEQNDKIFEHIKGQYFIQTSTFSYNDTMGFQADCVEYLELKNCQREIVSKNLWNTVRYTRKEHKTATSGY